MPLIDYAGKDPDDIPFSTRLTGWDASRQSRQFQAYKKFQRGMDTAKLAEIYGAKEQTVLKWISNERSKRLGLPTPYQGKL
jgi:transposase